MKEIPLTQGKIALVDDEDYESLNSYKWCTAKVIRTLYAHRITPRKDGKQTLLLMHRVLLGLEKGDGKYVDHIDHDGLNNQKSNLRIVTVSQNQMNRIPHKNTSSKYKGVYWYKKNKRWRSQIMINYKQIYLGQFEDEKEAARAYNRKAIELFGEYALLNDLG